MPKDAPLHPSPNTSRREAASEGRLRRALGRMRWRLRQEAGFTIVEVAVAAIVLIVGLLTTFNALDVTVRTSQVTRAREGAVNLAREITEDARALQYSSLTSSSAVTSALQTMPGLDSSSCSTSSTWTCTRRGITYTIAVTESDQAAVTSQTLSQKQIGVNISWTIRGITRNYTETSTLSSGGQGLSMSATALQWVIPNGTSCSSPCSATTPVIVSAMNLNTMTFSVQTPSEMSGVTWEINGVTQSWTSSYAITNATTWTWTTTTPWNIANLPDGTYEIGVAAQNGSSTGSYTKIFVRLQRAIPSAPSFSAQAYDGYGFNTNLYSGGTKTTAAELNWTGSNNPSVTGNDGDYNLVGYKITSPTGATCQTALTSLSGATTTFPNTCGTNFYCSSATACIDLSPPSTTSSSLTYTVAPLYYNSSNALSTGPTTSAALTGSTSTTYTLAPTTQNTSTNCATGNPQNDLRTTYTAGGTTTSASSTGSSVTATFCSAAMTQTTTIGGGGTATVYFTNANNNNCTVNGYLSIDGGIPLVNQQTVAASVANKATTFTWSWSNPTLNTGDRINNQYVWNCGSTTKPVTLLYGSTTSPSQLVTGVQPIQAPNAPTNLSVSSVSNTDGTTTATVTWKAPTSGVAVNAYRVYRDGQNYNNRYYYDTASNLCTSGTCTWTDSERSATHSYYVTAVGNTTAGSDMGESSMLGPATG